MSGDRQSSLFPPIPLLPLAVVNAAVSDYVGRTPPVCRPIGKAFTRSTCRWAVTGIIMAVGHAYWALMQGIGGLKVNCCKTGVHDVTTL